ncbi:GNAT family N-acetyltransferase [Pontibacter chitinilyticus]|uniref:GNAT family N-acetyltransferase n=1 Tax=Pontibacter chitinilyticus TaxID=2674989 RepID=UPI00321BC465
MTIRPFRKDDTGQLLELLRLNTPLYFAPSEEADLAEYLDKYAESYFVVEEGGKVIGAGGINYFLASGEARISWDILHPAYQGKGIGKQLLHYRIVLIKTNPAIRLVIVRTSQLVYKFYEKAGFRLEKVQKDFWAKGYDLYQLHLPLAVQQPAAI